MNYKQYRNKWTDNPEKHIVEDFPLHLDIECNTHCNLSCKMCHQSWDPLKKQVMPLMLYKKIIDEGAQKGLCAVKTQLRGEPLLCDSMGYRVWYAKSKGIMEVMFNTNGMKLTKETCEDMIDAGLDRIIVSVECSPEDYKLIRTGGNYDRVVQNMHTFLKVRGDAEKPILRAKAIDTENTFDFVKYWKDYNVEVDVAPLYDWKGPLDYPADFCCEQLWQRLGVLVDGTVIPCCWATSDIEGSKLGNVYDDTIESMWKGEKLRQWRWLHANGRHNEIEMCRKCGLYL